MPRGDMAGSAYFLDKRNKLMGEVVFGKVAGKEHEALLQRADSFAATIYDVTFAEQPRAASPPVSLEHICSDMQQFLLLLARKACHPLCMLISALGAVLNSR